MNDRRRLAPGWKALALVLALAPCPASASPDAGASQDREMAVLGEDAPLMAMPLGEAPGATTVITAAEIARSGAANIFELLRRVPGMDIRYTPMGGHIGIRSAGPSPFTEQVLLLIDGTPYNSPDKGGFPGHPNYRGFFPLDRIERIEIIKGPISVLYGANAFAGVINIVSKSAGDALKGEVEGTAYGATVLTGERDTFEATLRAALVKSGWETSAQITGMEGRTPVSLNGDADHERLEGYATMRRGRFSASVLHQQNSHGSFSFLGDPSRTARHDVDIIDTHYARRVGKYTLSGAASLNRFQGTTCAVCHNNQSGAPDDAVTSEVGDEREMDQRARVALRADRLLTDTQDLTFGFEAMQDSFQRDIVVVDEVEKHLGSGGVFVQHQWHFKGRRMHLISGLRHDRAEGLGGATSPRLAFVAEAGEDLVVRGSWSRAFRAPTWNERFLRQRFLPGETSPGTIVVAYGNEDLERERIDSAEAGVSWRAAPGLVIKADLYHNTLSEFIQRGGIGFFPGTPNETRLRYDNRDGDFTIRGGELTFHVRPHATVNLMAGYGYRDLSIGWDDPHAAYAPRSRAVFTAAWDPHPSWSLDVAGSYSSRYTVSNPNIFGLRPQPAYQLWDAAVRWTPQGQAGRISLALAGRNLFDKHPYESMNNSGIDTSLRGRVLALEVRADF
ncbi:MAG TPA: TonB-dependent receptor [Candidatus Polarisedimenticolia bacterium]|nr:TonB-dependent receptor [Candidatus Polarisedimenticolia bacterium]